MIFNILIVRGGDAHDYKFSDDNLLIQKAKQKIEAAKVYKEWQLATPETKKRAFVKKEVALHDPSKISSRVKASQLT